MRKDLVLNLNDNGNEEGVQVRG